MEFDYSYTMRSELQLDSPAKVNLRLEILRKRADGYHEIRTVFQKISLHDTIHFALRKERGISITTNQPDLPVGRGNLVYQAAEIILSRSNHRGGISIHLDKKIPLGAGLGGGSSNAATTLKALNHLFEVGLSRKEMMAIGIQIGADVPFFFLEEGAIATGIGERLTEIALPVLWYVLIYPNFEVSTRWAYQNSRLTKKKYRFKIQEFLTTPEEISKMLMNDLEDVVSKTFPQINLMKKILISVGAVGSLMTGSGPTVFGIFSDKADALKAYKKVTYRIRETGWLVLKAHSLPFKC
ncbi:MAG TPA: 4-(cytidine 5'-diphospho)-2-C-methyl-D-erythritol kinase [Thermodesulfobacteriota bacterium]|nr:4-(cytidine 5'-diphospho)-2-C-methyl-D-erythritol kinase [Thermodesulfobacteriota bacterium]